MDFARKGKYKNGYPQEIYLNFTINFMMKNGLFT